MLEKLRSKNKVALDDAIERVLFHLNEEEFDSDEYKHGMVYLERLTDIRQKKKSVKVSRDTWIIAGAGVIQVILIVFAEQNHVLVSKGLSFVLKPKNGSITT